MSRSEGRALRVLLVEDQPADAELVIEELIRGGFEPDYRRVAAEDEYLAALERTLDVILADFNLPGFGAMRALQLLQAQRLDVPFIVVSGSIGEEIAVEVLKSGASDYLLKDRLARLAQAVTRAIDERRLQAEKRRAEAALSVAEQRMGFALEAARVGTWEVDMKTRTSRWSPILETLHGLAPGSFGGTFEAFLSRIHPDDRQAVLDEIERAVRERTDSHLLYRTTWPDGRHHWISGVGRTIYDETGAPVVAAGIGMDVTAQRLLEEQYRQAQKMEAVGQLAGGIAHDFNNLLTAIQGYANLLAEDVDAASPLRPDLAEIQRAAERAASLTRQLLAFSRRQVLEPRVVNLGETLAAIEPMLRRLIGEHISVVVRIPPALSSVRVDPGQVEQVILNLAVNARDAMAAGGTLSLALSNVEIGAAECQPGGDMTPGRYVRLAVSDTGTGMDAATQARVFEPFFTTKPKGEGTGLGLATVYGIVRQSGGFVLVESRVGRGSTFNACFPAVDQPAERVVTRPQAGSVRGTETILVVEDEPGVRALVKRALERLGYRLFLAATPHEAIEIADRGAAIDLLISDVVLPETSGPTLARQLAARLGHSRVLFMSGYTDSKIEPSPAEVPTMGFLQKPFTPDALGRKVREVLDASRAREA